MAGNYGILLIIFIACAAHFVRGAQFSSVRNFRENEASIAESTTRCLREYPTSAFQLYTRFAWQVRNPVADCYMACVFKRLKYSDSDGVLMAERVKQKIRANSEKQTALRLVKKLDACLRETGNITAVCEKSFQLLNCFYRDSMLTALTKSLDLYQYFG